jgi:hypothetical protein
MNNPSSNLTRKKMQSISIARYQEQSIPVLYASVNTAMNSSHLTNLPREMMQSMAGFSINGLFFFLHVPPLIHLPASA